MSRPGRQIDVVMPTVGRWAFVRQALHTIEGQVGVAVRPIVVNDSGETMPGDIANSVVEVSTGGGAGEGAARARGLAAVTSPLVAFCDDDDRWETEKLDRQFERLAGRGGWCLTGAVWVDEHNAVIERRGLGVVAELERHGDLERRLLCHNPIPAGSSTILVSTDLLRSVGGWNTNLRYFADWDCWIRLIAEAPPVLVDEPLVRYRVWDGQMISDRRAAWNALDTIRRDHAVRRRELRVGPLDDRVILWILQGEWHTPGRRLAGMRAAGRRLAPRRSSDLLAVQRYGAELWSRLVSPNRRDGPRGLAARRSHRSRK